MRSRDTVVTVVTVVELYNFAKRLHRRQLKCAQAARNMSSARSVTVGQSVASQHSDLSDHRKNNRRRSCVRTRVAQDGRMILFRGGMPGTCNLFDVRMTVTQNDG